MLSRILLLALLSCLPLAAVTDVLMVADEIPAMEVLSKQLQTRIGVTSTICTQEKMPTDLAQYKVVMVYIHKSIGEWAELAFIAYAKGGGKLFLLHHSISSGKRENKEWFPFLDISLPNKPYAEGGYKYFDPADFDVVNLAPKHYITTHKVKFPDKVMYEGKMKPAFGVTETEVYLNHVFSGPRTTLLGIKYTDKTTGKVYEQPTAAWYRPADKGMVFYFMVGHKASDWDNPVYAQIVANAVSFAGGKRR
jgi:Trehalose utilisation